MSAHPDDIASVTAANRDRLMGVAAAISTITNSERQMNDLSDLEAKARAATQGEWSVLTSSLDSTRSIMAGDPAFFLARCHKSPVSDATANAAYIVAAQPSVVLELIERIRDAEAKAGEPVECGGCGNSDPAKRCIGCMHDFAAPVAATHRHKKRGEAKP